MNKKSICKSLWVLLLMSPVLALSICITKYGVDAVYWDEWANINLFQDVAANGLSFDKLYAQHNEHRMFFPRIFMLLSYSITGCSSKGQMYLSACMLAISYYFVVRQVLGRRWWIAMDWKDALFLALTGFCLMSTCQWENLLWGFQTAWFLIELSVIASLVFFSAYMENNSKKDWVFSVLFATIAVYSSLQGIAVWPMYLCIFLLFMFSKSKCKMRKTMILFSFIGVIETLFYFYGYTKIAAHEGFQAVDIRQCFRFFLEQTGSMFCGSNQDVAKYLGAAVIALAVFLIIYLTIRQKVEAYVVPIGMIIFSAGTLMMISIGRSNLVLSSRYLTFSVMLLTGEIIILYKEFMCQKQLAAAVLGMLLALGIVESMDCLQICQSVFISRTESREALLNFKDVPLEALQKAFPWQSYEQAYESIAPCAEKQWNVWKEPQLLYGEANTESFTLSESPLQDYYLDNVSWDAESRIFQLQGWAADTGSQKPYGGVYVKINDRIFHTKDHQERADVAAHLSNAAYTDSGFSFSKSTEAFQEGINEITLLLLLSDNRTLYASETFYIGYSKEAGLYRCDASGSVSDTGDTVTNVSQYAQSPDDSKAAAEMNYSQALG